LHASSLRHTFTRLMAPALAALLEATEGRSTELDAESEGLAAEVAALDLEIADKRAEKTIAAQNEVRELLKSKEALAKKAKLIGAAAGHVRLALAKLQRAKQAGLEDWKELREETVKLSDFARERLKEEATVAQLEASCAGGSVKVDGGSLAFAGSSAGLEGLRRALEQLESAYSCTIEVDALTLGILERRKALERQGEKHGVTVAKDAGGASVIVSGAAEKARKAEQMLKFMMSGKVDLPCPKELAGAAKAHAQDVEVETGSYVEVLRGGFGGGSIVHIRGDSEGVKDAEERMRAWFDEREGAYSSFVEAPSLAKLDAAKTAELTNDLWHFGQKFAIAASLCEGGVRVELRGPAGGTWEAPARAELKQLSDWYSQQSEEAGSAGAKAKATAQPTKKEEDDGWGAAPEAQFELGHKW